MANYLVTGGAGFIGSHITAALLKAGDRVRILDNFSTGREENLRDLQKKYPRHLEVLRGDLRDSEACTRAVSEMDFVFHQAALGSVPRSIEDPRTTQEVNIGGTLNILQAARQGGVQRVVYASSSSIYGDQPSSGTAVQAKKETMVPNPLSPYAVSKVVGEYYCRIFSRVYGLPAVSLRYFNVYGPRQDPGSEYAAVIPRFVTALLAGKAPTIYGDGKQSRDFTYVDNVVQANLKACQAPGVEGEAFNVALGRNYDLLQLLEILQRLTGVQQAPVFDPPRPGDPRHSKADIRRAKVGLGYRPQTGFQAGLKKTVAWMKKNEKK